MRRIVAKSQRILIRLDTLGEAIAVSTDCQWTAKTSGDSRDSGDSDKKEQYKHV